MVVNKIYANVIKGGCVVGCNERVRRLIAKIRKYVRHGKSPFAGKLLLCQDIVIYGCGVSFLAKGGESTAISSSTTKSIINLMRGRGNEESQDEVMEGRT